MQKSLDPRLTPITAVGTASKRDGEDDEIDLLELVRTVWRGKWWILLSSLVAIGIGGNYAFRMAVPTYSATAQMALQIQQASVIDIESVLSGFDGDRNAMNTELQVILSRDLIGQLVDRLDLMSNPEFNPTLRADEGGLFSDGILADLRDALLPAADETLTETQIRNEVITNVRDAFSTTSSRDSYMFQITATTEDPDTSVLLANTLAQVYREDQVAQKVAATESAAVWLSGRVSELQAELEERQAAMTDLRTQSALVSPESLVALNDRSVELQQALQTVQVELEEATALRAAMDAAADADNAEKAASVRDIQLTGILEAVERGDAGAQLRFDRRFESIRLQTSADVLRLTEQVRELQAEADRLKRQFEEQSSALAGLQELERETEATRVLYETFLTRLKETTVQEGVHQPDSRILSEATEGEMVSPRKARILALSMILGIIAGSAIVLMREMAQNTYRTAEDLEQTTGISVLGQIPRIPARGRPETVAYLATKPTSAAAEAVRNLRTSVL